MGVPSFFRWLTKKYPRVITDVVEERTEMVGDTEIPIDTSQPNPNGQEFDNLYLDMNGIIHPCTHPEDGKPPQSVDEMMVAIFAYIDRIFTIVRPRRLLYMAIDGVAPRAKMNQQRSRRFRAAKEAKEKKESDQALIDSGQGHLVDDSDKMKFDSNVITPGTPFMDVVAKSLRYYATEKINSDPGWKGIEVIISDSNIPGEGEHKIMDFIRKERIQEGYDPQTRHVLYGLDADLIMLALATHEVNFAILREVVLANKTQTCRKCGQPGHYADQCRGKEKERFGDGSADDGRGPALKPYQFLHVAVLREYLERDLKCPTHFPWDLERALDDWVFLCMFVGNDFLPHLPTLKIRDGAIDMLMRLYKKSLPNLPDFLTKDGDINLESVEVIMQGVAAMEDSILARQRQNEMRFRANQRRKKERENARKNGPTQKRSYSQMAGADANRDKAKRLRTTLHGAPAPPPANSSSSPIAIVETPKKKDDEELPDEVRLGEDGWKERYYMHKFKVHASDDTFKKQLCRDYIEGLVWVMKYYFQGCASWTWYFPHHYAPFSSDLTDLKGLSFHFDKSEPFRPFEQLMGVLPALSGHALPEVMRKLMSDPDSPIIDLYPSDFDIDMDGCKFAWQGVALLPFIDEKRLLDAVRPLEAQLTADEKRRNTPGTDMLFFHKAHPLATVAKVVYADAEEGKKEMRDLGQDYDLFGTVAPCEVGLGVEADYESPLRSYPSVKDNEAYAIFYEMPHLPADHKWKTGLLSNAKLPPKRLSEMDFLTERKRNNWGGNGGERMNIHYHGLQRGRGRGGHHHHHQQQRYPPGPPPGYGRGGYQGGHRGGRGGYHQQQPYHGNQRYGNQHHQQQRQPYNQQYHQQHPNQQQRYPQQPYPNQQQRYNQQPQAYDPRSSTQSHAPPAQSAAALDPALLVQAQQLVQQLQGQGQQPGTAYHRPQQPVQPLGFFSQAQQNPNAANLPPSQHPPYNPQ